MDQTTKFLHKKQEILLDQTLPLISRESLMSWIILKTNPSLGSDLQKNMSDPTLTWKSIWGFSKMVGFPPKSSILIGVFHSKPSILKGFPPNFWKHPFCSWNLKWSNMSENIPPILRHQGMIDSGLLTSSSLNINVINWLEKTKFSQIVV